ncbi:15168_t:CDS:2 [Racocetra fulgida]|uniref:15168_t:CDS:1 n=1 Tax=Racocetra fulgida TaxID=60492 RepID=A0A9N8Z1R6_9GLOM|nr:15168_t:CDS:2 [Racocetra fulgida]
MRECVHNDGEITEIIGYPCGSTFVDKEFHKFIGAKLDYMLYQNRKIEMEIAGWNIELDFASVKEMFDPDVNKILELISDQLKDLKKNARLYLVGGFAESAYLLDKIKENFRFQVDNICVPTLPIAALVRGGFYYR